jgi:hypothetical protein
MHRQQFEERLATKPAMKEIFLDYFGQARIKVLTLSVETSLVTQKPYAAPANGHTDQERALRHEATDHLITRTVLEVFEDSSIEDIKILAPKP